MSEIHNSEEEWRKDRHRNLLPGAAAWQRLAPLSARWHRFCTGLFVSMAICAFCGMTALGGASATMRWKLVPFTESAPPAALSNTIMVDHMRIEQESARGPVVLWHQCKWCSEHQDCLSDRACYIPSMSPTYVRSLLSVPPLHMQLLSIVDASVQFSERMRQMARGQVVSSNLLHNPLIDWTAAYCNLLVGSLPPALLQVLAHNLACNPVLQGFYSMAELPHPHLGLTVLPSTAISNIVSEHQARSGAASNMERDVIAQRLSILVDAAPAHVPPERMHPTVNAGFAYPRGGTGSVVLTTSTADNAGYIMHVDNAGKYTINGKPLTAEAALHPFLFPHGRGFYVALSNFPMMQYYQFRAKCLFTVYTLYKPYMLTAYSIMHAYEVLTKSVETTLLSRMRQARAHHPQASEDEVARRVMKEAVPPSVSGSPAYFRKQLNDLLAVVREHGLPHFFLTLTADEVSSTRWSEVSDLESLLNRFNSTFAWHDAPVECAHLFVKKVDHFMTDVLMKEKVIGEVKHHVMRLEVQHQGSLHAHIMLWMDEGHVNQTANEIMAFVPAVWNSEHQTWEDSTDPEVARLANLVRSKQLHRCTAEGCCKHGACKYGFPFQVQDKPETIFDTHSQRYAYYRPRSIDRNVVPYHPVLLYLWGAHMNMQRVTSAAWTVYLLKYALKTEPYGKLNLNAETLRRLGFTGASEDVLRIANAMVASRPVSSTEAACYLAGIDMVRFDDDTKVGYVNSLPPKQRTGMIIHNRFVTAKDHSVQVYECRPPQCENTTFHDYYRWYLTSKKEYKRLPKEFQGAVKVGVDALQNHVYHLQRPRIIRFSNCHPVKNVEGYCYQLLLRNVPFRNESDLLGSGGSYMSRCIDAGIISSVHDLEVHLIEYCREHLHTSDNLQAMLDHILDKASPDVVAALHLDTVGDVHDAQGNVLEVQTTRHSSQQSQTEVNMEPSTVQNVYELLDALFDEPTSNPGSVPHAANDPASQATEAAQFLDMTRCSWFPSILTGTLTDDQFAAAHKILHANNMTGLFVLSGGPGTGKSHLTRVLAAALHHAGKKVLMCASTGAAAVRLSSTACTVHHMFNIPDRLAAYVPTFRPDDPRGIALQQADVIFIDEFSMLTAQVVNRVMARLQASTRSPSIAELLSKKLIVLVGDAHQLPPVCQHTADPVCMRCRITSSSAWPHACLVDLTTNIRASADAELTRFQATARTGQPTQEFIDSVFGTRYIRQQDVYGHLSESSVVLCSHNEDVDAYNHATLHKLFQRHDIVPIPVESNGVGVPELQGWLTDNGDRFHTLTEVAVNARVIVTENLDLSIGAANGAEATVKGFSFDNRTSMVNGIYILIHSTGQMLCVRKCKRHTKYLSGSRTYFKKTFPLQLAYALTGHAAQGATYDRLTIVHIRHGFVAGLGYVMTSRNRSRDNMLIVNRLTPGMLVPVPPLA